METSDKKYPTNNENILQLLLYIVFLSFMGLTINKYMNIINGNQKNGYRIMAWNCRRGIINNDGTCTEKFFEVINMVKNYKPHLFCLIELDLHGILSRYKKQKYFTTNEVRDILNIVNYKIILPSTWKRHGQARIIVFAQENLNVNVIEPGVSYSYYVLIVSCKNLWEKKSL